MFIDDYGYVNASPFEQHAENSMLFTVENALIRKYKDYDDGEIKEVLENGLRLMKLSKGIYRQNPSDSLVGKDKLMSHDQMTAIFAICKVYGWSHSKDIWQEIKRQNFRYDNMNPENPSWSRILHPRDIIYYGMCEGSKLWFLLLPILFAMSLWSCIRKYKYRGDQVFVATDSKLLTFVRFVPFLDNFIMRQMFKLMTTIIGKKFNNGWKGVFSVYFTHPQHPNNILWE